MNKQFLTVLAGAVILMFPAAGRLFADDGIQVFVNDQGKMVFTNLVENPAAAAAAANPSGSALPPTGDVQIPAALDSLVNAISKSHGIDPGLVKAVMKTESGFNRWAVSSKGAMGLMQLIPGTGRRFGVRDFFDPQQNIEGGVRYLKFLTDKFDGNLDLLLAAYNAGENLVARLGRIPPIPETTAYVRKVRSIYTPQTLNMKERTGSPVTNLAEATAERAEPETPRIFTAVDTRGVVHFSNIEPPN